MKRARKKTSPATARRSLASFGSARLLILTGLSGSGKGTVLKTLEDLGYTCVDNLPIDLIPTFADLYLKTGEAVERAALVVDIREREALDHFPQLYQRLRRTVPVSLVFVQAADAALVRRFSETRRPHPLGAELPVQVGIQQERKLLEPIRALADVVVDTTRFTPHDLRQFVRERFARSRRQPMLISVVSFGYRFGVPPDADLVFDVRFLPNPNFVPAYQPLSGKNPGVTRYVLSFPQTREFVSRVTRLLFYLLPYYIREGKSYLTIAFGCTGGRHRSVVLAQAVRRQLGRRNYGVKIFHRDLEKGG